MTSKIQFFGPQSWSWFVTLHYLKPYCVCFVANLWNWCLMILWNGNGLISNLKEPPSPKALQLSWWIILKDTQFMNVWRGEIQRQRRRGGFWCYFWGREEGRSNLGNDVAAWECAWHLACNSILGLLAFWESLQGICDNLWRLWSMSLQFIWVINKDTIELLSYHITSTKHYE